MTLTHTRHLLAIVAGIALCFFTAAAPTHGNWQLPLGVMMLALFAYFTLPHYLDERRAHRAEREASQRLQMAAYRHGVWARRMGGQS